MRNNGINAWFATWELVGFVSRLKPTVPSGGRGEGWAPGVSYPHSCPHFCGVGGVVIHILRVGGGVVFAEWGWGAAFVSSSAFRCFLLCFLCVVLFA